MNTILKVKLAIKGNKETQVFFYNPNQPNDFKKSIHIWAKAGTNDNIVFYHPDEQQAMVVISALESNSNKDDKPYLVEIRKKKVLNQYYAQNSII